VARRLAADTGVDLAAVAGSGPDGRILKTDVMRASTARPDRSPSGPATRVVIPLSPMQATVARRMTIAKQTVPHYYLSMDVDMTDVNALRRQLRTARVTITDVVVRAVALALAEMPAVNASWSDGGLVWSETVDVGIAVALEDGGLVVPVLHDAAALPLLALARSVGALVERARTGSLTAAELSGGTFTVSNLGGFGVRELHAIVNPPESGILGVGALVRTPVARDDDTIGVRELMSMSLSADHRVYSGATGASFLRLVRELLEAPAELFVSQGSG
jgi:pyruvate dehydrogenase E2 component (dihydrolipoamide acetyltransferase)